MSRLVSALFVACVLVGCGASGPEKDLNVVLRYMTEPGITAAQVTEMLYANLDSATKKAIDARAAALTEKLGRPVPPHEAIQFRGFGTRARIDKVEVTMTSDTTATLHIDINRASVDIATDMPTRVDLKAVLEDGRWKLSWPELAASVAAADPSATSPAAPAPVPAPPAEVTP